ncbi:MAG TPA: YcaO-like family protein [Kofleriaceae bacterium]|nr:YcaO-like family protein [Kofleriaceae bacterium]
MLRRFYDQVLDAPTRLRDGTHRTATLGQTWRRFSPVARRAGITRIADITGLDTLGIPVFTAIRPMGRSLSTQQGKGLTPEAARISALMESLETFTAEQARATVRGSYRALAKKRRVVDVRKLPRPRGRLDLDATWPWIEGWDLARNEPVLVPLESVTLDTTFTRPPVFDISSNGLASGNVLVEAIVHGLCEVLERDAEAAWRRSGGDRRLVLDTVDNPMIERITRTGARVFLWDLGGPIAAIGCAIVEDPNEIAWRPLGCYQGFGAHLVPEVAIARALTEAAQTRLTYIAGGRDDFFPFDYERATDPDLLRDMWDRLAAPCDDPVDARDLPRHETSGLGEDLDVLVGLAGESVIAVDLTLKQLGVPVAKVIVPGRATDVEALG